MNQNTVFYRLVNSLIRMLLAGALFLLLLHSLFGTAFVGRIFLADGSEQERALNIADTPLRHAVLFILCSASLFLARRLWQAVKDRDPLRWTDRRDDLVFWGLALFTFLAGTVYVLATQFEPGSDPAKVYGIAMQWRQGDFSAFEEGEYLFHYPFQSGIVLFFYLFSFLFGVGNYVAFQLVNVVCLVLIDIMLAKLAGSFWPDKGLRNVVYCGLLVWTPLAFYVTYLYGILPGMALSLGAVWFALRYLSKRRYRYLVFSSLCMGIATVIKMNCLIWLIAIVCFLGYDALTHLFLSKEASPEKGSGQKNAAVSLLFILCLAGSVLFCNGVNNRIVERIAGQELPEGIPMTAWVVMGLQEAPLGPGGFNGYITSVFSECGYDAQKAEKVSKQELQRIVNRLTESPLDEGLPFLARKTAFQWNDPTFICLDRTRGRKSAVELSAPLQNLIYGKGSVRLSLLLNDMQTLIWLGALLYVLLRQNSGNLNELIGMVIFLGGYLFHLFWESSASYTIPYFVLLIPYAVCGMAEWVEFMENRIAGLRGIERTDMRKKSEQEGELQRVTAGRGGRKKVLKAALAIAFGLLVFAFMRTNLFDRTIALNDDLQGIDASDQYYQRGVWETEY